MDLINDTLKATNSTAELNKAWEELALEAKLKAYPDQNDANMIKRDGAAHLRHARTRTRRQVRWQSAWQRRRPTTFRRST
jgi:hypothetical protein